MPTTTYRNKEGQLIPGTTTIIGSNLGWKTQGLVYWAWQKGMNGEDFRSARDEAADAGTIAHEMIECEIKGKKFDPSKYDKSLVDKAENAYLSFLEFKDKVNFEVIKTEVHLVSEKYQYGATPDCIAKINGKVALFDWKTSDAIYPDYLIQIAAYEQAWNENNPDMPITDGCHLLRISKGNNISYEWRYWSNLKPAWEAFLCCLKLHQLKKEIKKL